MKLKYEERIEQVKKEIETTETNIGIIFHCDADGVSSASQLYRCFLNKNVDLATGELEERTVQKLKGEYDTVFIVDLPIDHYSSWLKNLNTRKIVVIDHHPPKKDLEEEGIIHVNPRLDIPDVYVSASQIVYEILKDTVKNIEWIMRIGAVGDRAIEGSEKEMRAVEYIDAVKAIKGEDELVNVVRRLVECRNLDEFLDIKEYKNLAEEVNKEIKKWVEKFEKEEQEKDVIIFEIDTKYSIISRVANELFDRYPEKTIIVYSYKNGIFKISGRSRKIDIGKLFKEITKGIGKGGGHPVAAGARVEADKIDIFLKRLKSKVRI